MRETVRIDRSEELTPPDMATAVAIIRELEDRNQTLEAKLQEIEEAMMAAGGVATYRQHVADDKILASFGKTDRVLGVADRAITVAPGDLVQSDINSMVMVAKLGSGEDFACDTAEFVKRNPDGTLTLRTGNGTLRVYSPAGALRNGASEGLQSGDMLLVNEDARFAYRVHTVAECRNYARVLPDLTFAGSRDVLKQIDQLLFEPLFGDASQRIAGMLVCLSGPTGSGKSHACKAISKRRGVHLIYATYDDVASSFVSETGKGLKALFSQAIELAQKGEKVVILIEEANTLAGKRTGFRFQDAASREFGNISSSLITQLDRLIDLGPDLPIAVCFTTNVLSEFDSAIRSRVQEEITVGYIDRSYATELLEAHLEAMQVELTGGKADVDRLVDVLFDSATPLVQVEAEIGKTVERFRLMPADMIVPRLVSSLASALKREASPVQWEDAVRSAHTKILAHSRQVADSPEHYVPFVTTHPFAGDPDLAIRRASAVYPGEVPVDFLL